MSKVENQLSPSENLKYSHGVIIHSIGREMLVGALSSMLTTPILNPFEVAKSRMQMVVAGSKRSLYATLKNLVRTEGPSSIQQGLVCFSSYFIALNTFRLGLYKPLSEKLNVNFNSSKRYTTLIDFVAGAITGCIGCLAGNPFLLIKTRQQSGNVNPLLNYSNKGTIESFQIIIKNEGLRGLYVGIDAALPRVVIGSGFYTNIKKFLCHVDFFVKNPIALQIFSSIVTAIFTTTFINPFDTVSTRMYNQASSDSAIEVARKIMRHEGFKAFYKGYFPLYLRIAPTTTLTLVTWELINDWIDQYFD